MARTRTGTYDRRRLGCFAAAFAAAMVVGACAGPTTYRQADSPTDEGYRTTQLSENRYRVSFDGNAVTSRETVESYLLFRAAELAQRTGHPYFAVVDDETERQVDVERYYSAPGFYGYGPRLGYGPGFAGFPYYSTLPGYWPRPQVVTRDSYEAFATIEMLDARPADRDDVFDASKVTATLGPQVEFPKS